MFYNPVRPERETCFSSRNLSNEISKCCANSLASDCASSTRNDLGKFQLIRKIVKVFTLIFCPRIKFDEEPHFFLVPPIFKFCRYQECSKFLCEIAIGSELLPIKLKRCLSICDFLDERIRNVKT